MKKNKKILITIKEAVEFLGLPESRLRKLCRYNEDFPAFKIDGRYYINREQAKEWAKKMTE